MFLSVHVDDILIARSSEHATQYLFQELTSDFALENFGDLHYFLGI
jgi:hypothetical protein